MADHTAAAKGKCDDQDPDDSFSTLIKLLDADVIPVKVGTVGSKTFIVHKDTICRKSALFKDLCDEHGTGKRIQIIELPEVDPELFEQ